MNFNVRTLIWAFLWSIFMGITVGSIGLGSAFPSLNRIAKPFVCPAGEMQLETQNYTPSPVESVTTLTWYCTEPGTGVREELGIFPMSLYAGAIYGLLLFAVIALVLWFQTFRKASDPSSAEADTGIDMESINRNLAQAERFRQQAEAFRDQATGRASQAGKSAVDKMRELQELRQSNLISETEYKQKRKEILKEL